MPFNLYENVSTGNPMPVQEVEGSYNRYEPISASNPLPVMEVEGGEYSGYGDISQTNPQPVAIIADSGTYSKYENESDTNAFPVKFITGQSYDPRQDISETNPWPVVVVSGGGEEPGPYTTGAVNFDGQALLSTASLVSTDNEYAALSFWVKVPLSGPGGGYVLVGDPNGTFYPYFNIVNGGQGFGINIADAAGASFIDASEGMALAGLAEWHHVLLAFQTNLAAGNKILKGYVDDVLVFSAPGNDPSDAFDISTNGKEFVFGGYGDPMDGIAGDFADVWFAPGANLLTAGDIAEATRRKFISAEGKPVNLGADGSTPTGTAPAMFFRRAPAAAASTFGNNLGTGGAFTITGTLTNAATSPSD